jgi:hypothetical protein
MRILALWLRVVIEAALGLILIPASIRAVYIGFEQWNSAKMPYHLGEILAPAVILVLAVYLIGDAFKLQARLRSRTTR